MNINSLKYVAVLAVIFLTACTTTSNNSKTTNSVITSDYKHILSIKSTGEPLAKALATQINIPFVNIYSTYKLGGYTLILNKKTNQATLLSNPQLFGMIRKETRPTSFITSYKLINFIGEIIVEGEVVTIGENHTIITPSLIQNTKLTPAIITDIAKQLKPIIEQNLYPIKWQAVVIGKHDYRHVIIQFSKKEGVKIGDTFTAPNNAVLQVVAFDEISDLAILRVTDGLLPLAGSKLSFINKNAKK